VSSDVILTTPALTRRCVLGQILRFAQYTNRIKMTTEKELPMTASDGSNMAGKPMFLPDTIKSRSILLCPRFSWREPLAASRFYRGKGGFR